MRTTSTNSVNARAHIIKGAAMLLIFLSGAYGSYGQCGSVSRNDDPSLCVENGDTNVTFMFVGVSTDDIQSYQWFVNGSSTSNQPPSGYFPENAFRRTTWGWDPGATIYCRIQLNNGSYCNSDTLQLSGPVGEVEIFSVDNSSSRCKGSGETVFHADVDNGTDFYWNISGGAGSITPSVMNPSNATVTWNSGFIGTTTISVEVHGCGPWEESDQFFYKVDSIPLSPQFDSLVYCDFDVITLTARPDFGVNYCNWYSSTNVLLASGQSYRLPDIYPAGVYSFKADAVNLHGCSSSAKTTFTVTVTHQCDDSLNWIKPTTYTYLENGLHTPKVLSASKAYFDLTGRPLQAQIKMFTDSTILTSQTVSDKYGRGAISMLPAPMDQSSFHYNHWFVRDQNGELYNEERVGNPLGYNEGTLGAYYHGGDNHVAASEYPYSQVDYYEDGTGEVRKSAGPGEAMRMGSGHEVLSGTFPVFSELNDYMLKRTTAISGIVHDSSLVNEGVQQVTRDQNGKYVVAITDKEGKTVMTARKGTSADHVLAVETTLTSQATDADGDNYRPMIYLYLLDSQFVSLTPTAGAAFIVENIVTNEEYEPEDEEEWPAGFYRLLLDTGVLEIGYTNYYLDVAYQFYDDAGRLVSSVSPNGYKAWVNSTPYASIDKTTYVYNHRGWLLSMTEPDAGTTRYMYRKDGKIRFSQNAVQDSTRFSYTHYDQLGRPVESGEYKGTALKFKKADLGGLLETPASGISWSSGDKVDWVKTYYDYPYDTFPNLPDSYTQKFMRGAVSSTENANNKTWYSYDEFGRVTWMAQKPTAIDRTFVTQYAYDFSGNVLTVENMVFIDDDSVAGETFYHHYEYDADQRLLRSYTSTDSVTKKLRATYSYYVHGPLKRIDLGDSIQGIDFVYNINGWLTQINHPDKTLDPGGDDNDAFGMVLDYYESDMTGIFPTSSNSNEKNNPLYFHNLLPEEKNTEQKTSVAFEAMPAYKNEDYRQSMMSKLSELRSIQTSEEKGKEQTQVIAKTNDDEMPAIEDLVARHPQPPEAVEMNFSSSHETLTASANASLLQSPPTDVVPDATEFAVLKKLYDSLAGSTWTRKNNWPTSWPASATSAQFGTWYGITVTNGDISAINLSSNHLVGKLPTNLPDLTQLTDLNLGGNNFAGKIPSWIGTMTGLTVLRLYQCQFNGSIPSSFTGLTNLSLLYLYANSLTGGIPDLSSITGLTDLRLHQNLLTSPIPSTLGSLTNLTTLYLASNDMTGSIPSSLNNLTNLTFFDLSGNALTDTIPDLSNLIHLTTFDVASNNLSGKVPAWLGDFADLDYIYMSSNNFSGPIPSELGQLSGLLHLNLSGNNLSGNIPTSLGQLTSSVLMDLHSNNLTGSIPSSLGNCVNLVTLSLYDNQLTGIIPPELGNLTQLVTLYLQSNQLSGGVPSSMGNLTLIKNLSLATNKLTGEIPSTFENLTEMVTFSVSTNQLSGPVNFVSTWTKATQIFLLSNLFSGAFPSGISNCTLLTTLRCEANLFTSLPSSLNSMTKVTTVSFQNNSITTVPNFSSQANKANLVLNLSNNFIDFANMQPIFGTSGTHGIKTFTYSPQRTFAGGTVHQPKGSTLVLSAAAKGSYSTVTWEKKVNATTWSSVNSVDEDATLQTYTRSNMMTSLDGTYRWTMTNSKVASLTLQSAEFNVLTVDEIPAASAAQALFNGLISAAYWRTDNIYNAPGDDMSGVYRYEYDDKYQIKDARFGTPALNFLTFTDEANKYRVTGLMYDPNGNIDSLRRYDVGGLRVHNFGYGYAVNKNQLTSVSGYVSDYDYNAIGQMVKEDKIDANDQYVQYDVTGKVRKVCFDQACTMPNVEYLYDDRGFRLAKIDYQSKKKTWYIRDASGNVISIYEQKGDLPNAQQPLRWKDLAYLTDTNGNLSVATGTSGTARSIQIIKPEQDAWIKYKEPVTQRGKNIGFRTPGTASSYYFQFYPSNNVLAVRKAGNLQTSVNYTANDSMRIEKHSDKISFYKNNTLVIDLAISTTAEFEVFAELTESVSTFNDVKFSMYNREPDPETFVLKEIPVYGSGKLGTYYPQEEGSTAFEITDHLGNVRAIVRDNINVYTATMEDNGAVDYSNPRVGENAYFLNIFETEVTDVNMNHSAPIPGVEESPDKSAYLFWQDGVSGIEAEDKAVGPSIVLKVNKGDKVSMETWARYESKVSYARDVPLLLMSQLLGSNFAFTGGFEANNVVQTTDAFEELLVPGVLDDGTDDSKPFAYLNYIVFDDEMEVVTSGWKRVNGDGAFDPGEEAYADMHEHVFIDDTIAIAQNGYIYVWVSNESEDTKVWFDDLKVTHEGGIVTQATDFGVWGDVLREEKADESAYRFGYQGQFSERDLETGWNHFELREYDAVVGRWLVTDPARQYMSPYVTFGGDPINRIDPDGGDDDPVFNSAGQYIGSTIEGRDVGTPIIYDGDLDFTTMTAGQLTSQGGKVLEVGLVFDGTITVDAFKNVLNDVMARTQLPEGVVEMDRLLNGSVSVALVDHLSGKKYSANEGVYSAKQAATSHINYNLKFKVSFYHANFELSVKNIQGLLGIHEYYGHGMQYMDHRAIYELQKLRWEGTTERYKANIESALQTGKFD